LYDAATERDSLALAEREAKEAAEKEAAFAALDEQAIQDKTAKECQCCFGEGADQTMGTLKA
jgi:hypothetical protein